MIRKLALAGVILALAGVAQADTPVKLQGNLFVHEGHVVDVVLTGPSAKALWDQMPGKGEQTECGAGLRKGGGKLGCRLVDGQYSCEIWVDAKKGELTPALEDDC